MLIFPVPIILNLLANFILFVIYVCLITEIEFDAGVEGELTYV